MQWHTQAGNINTNLTVEVDFNSPELTAKNVVKCKSCVDDSAKGSYDIILGRDILTELGLNSRLYDHIIEADDGPFKGPTVNNPNR